MYEIYKNLLVYIELYRIVSNKELLILFFKIKDIVLIIYNVCLFMKSKTITISIHILSISSTVTLHTINL